ncbi:unknown [Bacteroides sp. CAG:462]|nr:unknown [Bacteroides sp. CAG:462]
MDQGTANLIDGTIASDGNDHESSFGGCNGCQFNGMSGKLSGSNLKIIFIAVHIFVNHLQDRLLALSPGYRIDDECYSLFLHDVIP